MATRRDVDSVKVAEWLAHGQALIAGHADECECPWCMSADLDQVVAARGLDPARYMEEKPTARGGFRSAPWWETKLPAGTRWLRRPEVASPESVEASRALAGPPGPVVRVLVDYIGPGVWVRIEGADLAGNPLTVAGPVVGGPDEVDGAIAVKVRDYRAGWDRVVLTDPGTLVDLADEDAEREHRTAWALAPILGEGAGLVHLLRRRTRKDGKRRDTDRWFPEMHENVPAAQLAEWEQGNPDVRLSAVHHGHLPAMETTR